MFNTRNSDLLSKTGLSVDPVTNVVTGAETCKYIPDAASDDYSGYGGAAPLLLHHRRGRDPGPVRRLLGTRDAAAFPRRVTGPDRCRPHPPLPAIIGAHRNLSPASMPAGTPPRSGCAPTGPHILPCAVLARLGFVKIAIAHYTKLFHRLEQLAT
ncbi:MAG: hypothetical protein WDN06_20395 [Asticcacaulis sp.]